VTPEHVIQNQIREALSQYGKFFRSSVGQAWTGNEIIKTEGGGVYIPKARPFNTGLPVGFSDLLGVVTVTVTPEMVGQQLGIATFIEVKTNNGRVSNDQKNFLSVMAAAGCRAGVARDVESAVNIARGIK
jgi:hypothetical protein